MRNTSILTLIMATMLAFSIQAEDSYKELIKALHSREPSLVNSLLRDCSINKEEKNKIVRVSESILAQETYKKNRFIKRMLMHIITGSICTALCMLYLSQENIVSHP